jgi:hypothetical protein
MTAEVVVVAKKPYTRCQNAESHRKAQSKYVAKDPAAQRARVKKSEAKHPSKKKAPAKGGSSSSKKGRPRKC